MWHVDLGDRQGGFHSWSLPSSPDGLPGCAFPHSTSIQATWSQVWGVQGWTLVAIWGNVWRKAGFLGCQKKKIFARFSCLFSPIKHQKLSETTAAHARMCYLDQGTFFAPAVPSHFLTVVVSGCSHAPTWVCP